MHNYNKYAGKRKENAPVDEVVEQSEVETTVSEQPEITPAADPFEYGYVVDCEKLNVRETPTANSKTNIVGTLNKGDNVRIDDTSSSDEWYGVCAENGLKGFVMRKYILID